MKHVIEIELAGRRLTLETGRIAKQADGAIWATYGDTVILATAVASQNAKPGVDFLPLTVDYQEKTYAAGKIPGGYFKREGRPSEREVLTSRLIDRPLRPLFPEGYYFETQVITSVLSADKTGVSDVIAITAASAALAGVPWCGLVPTPEKANSLMLVRPMSAAPAARKRATAGASRVALGASASTMEPAAVGWPATSNRSLTETGSLALRRV